MRDFGAHQAAYPVNRSHDRSLGLVAAVLVVAPVPFAWMAYTESPWGDGTGSIPGMIASGLAALVFGALAVLIGVPGLLGLFSHPHATVHLFERGAIAIRHRGGSWSWPYENATVRHVLWHEPWEGDLRPRKQLWVTFRDGETICFDGLGDADAAVLPDLSVALGGNREPEDVGTLRAATRRHRSEEGT
ncbi:hypothetical protein ACFQBY_00615 [Promicromonospora citrea]|uniref:hypothetical protein n=1 Tax=Promicromonospora citrea TaxID=43677 RepID=UPI0036155708